MKVLKIAGCYLLIVMVFGLNGCQSDEEITPAVAKLPVIESAEIEFYELTDADKYVNGKPSPAAMAVGSVNTILLGVVKTSCDRYTLTLNIPSGGFADPNINPQSASTRISARAELQDANGNVLISYPDSQFVHSGDFMTGRILTAGIVVNADGPVNLKMKVRFSDVIKSGLLKGFPVASSGDIFAIQFGIGSSTFTVQKTCAPAVGG
jgi:hypothetical protein